MKTLNPFTALSRIFRFWKPTPKTSKSVPDPATALDLTTQKPVGVICILTDDSPAGFKVTGPCYEDPLIKARTEQ